MTCHFLKWNKLTFKIKIFYVLQNISENCVNNLKINVYKILTKKNVTKKKKINKAKLADNVEHKKKINTKTMQEKNVNKTVSCDILSWFAI